MGMTAPSPASEPPGESEERRAWDRTQCLLEVAVSKEQGSFKAATVLDLSRGGIKLLVDPPPAPGDKIRLTFLEQNGRLFQMVATAVYYIEHGNTWAVGCKFARELTEQELTTLL
jgi:hypothetical protein